MKFDTKLFYYVVILIFLAFVNSTPSIAQTRHCRISTVAGDGDDRLGSDDEAIATEVHLGIGKAITIDSSDRVVFSVLDAWDANESTVLRVNSSGRLEFLESMWGDEVCNDLAFDPLGNLICGGVPIVRLTNLAPHSYSETSDSLLPYEDLPFGVHSVAVDAEGNIYYDRRLASDPGDGFPYFFANTIWKLSPDGTTSMIAGREDAFGYDRDGVLATDSGLNGVHRLTFDALGNLYFRNSVAPDDARGVIRKISPEGIITRFAGKAEAVELGDDGPATSASLLLVDSWVEEDGGGIAVDSGGNVYIADTFHHRVRKVSPDGIISTVAGNGIEGFSGDGGEATTAKLNKPIDVAVDSQDRIYILDNGNHRIRKVRCRTNTDLRLSVGVASRRAVGRPFSLNFTVINNGPGEAENVILNERLPVGLEYVSYTPGSAGPVTCSYVAAARRVICNFGIIENRRRRSVVVNVRPSRSGSFENRANVSTTEIDTNASNNSATSVFSVTR